jgi:hypothetical protein
MGEVSKSVTPKFGLLAAAREGGTIAARCFMPWQAHPSMAVTGAQCLASCVMTPGSIAEGLVERPASSPAKITIEHPTGSIDVLAEYDLSDDGFTLLSAGLIRTARKLADGNLYIRASIWENQG